MDESVQPEPRMGAATASSPAAPTVGPAAGSLPEPGDDALLARIAQGDRQAFALLASRHAPKAMKLAQRILGNAADADEVVQEAMLRVWTGAKNWIPDGRARFSTWLHRVVVNLCVDRRRRPAFAGLEGIPEPPDPTPSAVSVMARQQTAKLVSQALAELPERQRLAVTLCYYEERSAADAAQILSLSVSAVESLLARARRALRARLSGVVQDTGEV